MKTARVPRPAGRPLGELGREISPLFGGCQGQVPREEGSRSSAFGARGARLPAEGGRPPRGRGAGRAVEALPEAFPRSAAVPVQVLV